MIVLYVFSFSFSVNHNADVQNQQCFRHNKTEVGFSVYRGTVFVDFQDILQANKLQIFISRPLHFE